MIILLSQLMMLRLFPHHPSLTCVIFPLPYTYSYKVVACLVKVSLMMVFNRNRSQVFFTSRVVLVRCRRLQDLLNTRVSVLKEGLEYFI